MTKHSKTRRSNLQSVQHLYTRKFAKATWCIYCGGQPETEDHVFPVSIAAQINWSIIGPKSMQIFRPVLVIVPCCHSCNSLASSYNPASIRDKRRYIQDKLRKKYKAMRMWANDELDELAPAFRGYVKRSLKSAIEAQSRILWPSPVRIYD
jgi:hypothetical protein